MVSAMPRAEGWIKLTVRFAALVSGGAGGGGGQGEEGAE